MKKNKIPRLWGIPLFDDYNLWNASDKDLERLEKDEISIVRYIGFFCMISLFIYYLHTANISVLKIFSKLSEIECYLQ